MQKVIRAQGEYVKKGEDIKDGDLVAIVDEGQMVTGDYGDRMVFKITTKNGDKNLSFNQKSMNNLIDSWGDDTKSWIGKKAKIWMVKAMVSGKFQDIVYLADPSWNMLPDGSFNGPVAVKITPQQEKAPEEVIPIIDVSEDYPEGEIDPKDIPF